MNKIREAWQAEPPPFLVRLRKKPPSEMVGAFRCCSGGETFGRKLYRLQSSKGFGPLCLGRI